MGFQLERFVSEIDSQLLCSICKCVLENAVQLSECEHIFCSQCIQDSFGFNGNTNTGICPVDDKIVSKEVIDVPESLNSRIKQLQIKCDFQLNGCESIVTLEQLPLHVDKCSFNVKNATFSEEEVVLRAEKNIEDGYDVKADDEKDEYFDEQSEQKYDIKDVDDDKYVRLEGNEKKELVKSKGLPCEDIGKPYDFKHLIHVRPEDLNQQMLKFIKVAGLSKDLLEDKDSKSFIYDYISKQGGINAALKSVQHKNEMPNLNDEDGCSSNSRSIVSSNLEVLELNDPMILESNVEKEKEKIALCGKDGVSSTEDVEQKEDQIDITLFEHLNHEFKQKCKFKRLEQQKCTPFLRTNDREQTLGIIRFDSENIFFSDQDDNPLINKNCRVASVTRKPIITNKPSALLYHEENEIIFSLLGKRCLSLCTAVVQLMVNEMPSESNWTIICIGAACLVKDYPRRSYLVKVYNFNTQELVWEQDLAVLTDKSSYSCIHPLFHIIREKNRIIGLNFADDKEAIDFKEEVEIKLMERFKRQDNKEPHSSPQMQNKVLSSPQMQTKTHSSPQMQNKTLSSPQMQNKAPDKAPDKASEKPGRRKMKISKDEIGGISNFRHIEHVGWDDKHGFDMECMTSDVATQSEETKDIIPGVNVLIRNDVSPRLSPLLPTRKAPNPPPSIVKLRNEK